MDAGKIRSLDSALRELLVSARPSPALPSAETASDHELGHPGRNGVIVNLSGSSRDAGGDTRRPAEGAHSAPLETAARETAAVRGADVLARALHAAHTGVTATVAQALARADDHAASDFDVPRTTLADIAANAPGAPRTQAGPIAPGVVPPEAGTRVADPHVAAMLMMAGPGATVGSVYSEHVRQATAPAPAAVPRPAPELVAPFLVRQEQAEPPMPYINYAIAGAGLLGLVLLLAL